MKVNPSSIKQVRERPSIDQPRTIAIIEDEQALRDNYVLALEKAGHRTRCFSEVESATTALRDSLPDLAIIDIGLGRDTEGGFELCRRLRQLSATLPILFLTARDSDIDVISGLRLGADDYLVKDISLAHLVARVNALFLRNDVYRQVELRSAGVRVGQLHLDADRLDAKWQTQSVELTVTEFWLVHCLVKQPGQVCSRQQLMQAASVVLDDQTITAHIKRIRRKFESISPDFSCIQTVYGMGYRWVDSVPDNDLNRAD